MPNVTMTQEQFVTLTGWAESYGLAQDTFKSIRELTETIEAANSLTRQFLIVRWRDGNARPVADDWDYPPQSQQLLLRYTTPWTYEEVMAAVEAHTANPVTVEVTRDRTGTVGWYAIDNYFDR